VKRGAGSVTAAPQMHIIFHGEAAAVETTTPDVESGVPV
jgi:hypothetical protein